MIRDFLILKANITSRVPIVLAVVALIYTIAMGSVDTKEVLIMRPMADCKWMRDEICVNADCPACADYCPVPDYPGMCKYEERGDDDAACVSDGDPG